MKDVSADPHYRGKLIVNHDSPLLPPLEETGTDLEVVPPTKEPETPVTNQEMPLEIPHVSLMIVRKRQRKLNDQLLVRPPDPLELSSEMWSIQLDQDPMCCAQLKEPPLPPPLTDLLLTRKPKGANLIAKVSEIGVISE